MKRFFHAGLALWHLALGSIVAGLSNDFSLPITGSKMDGPPGPEPGEPTVLAEVRVGPAVAVFLFLACLDHAWAAIFWTSYRERQYKKQRWVEYSLSATLMMMLVALLCGISEITSILHIWVNYPLCMLCGYFVEREEEIGIWFVLGSALALPVWVGAFTQIGINTGVPWFVWLIVFSMLFFFSLFPAVQYIQFEKRWVDADKADDYYCWLSLFAKTSLALLVFSNTLV